MSGSVFRWVGVCKCLGLCSGWSGCVSVWVCIQVGMGLSGSVFRWVGVCKCLGLCSGGYGCVSVWVCVQVGRGV